jgi:hypothetical protein
VGARRQGAAEIPGRSGVRCRCRNSDDLEGENLAALPDSELGGCVAAEGGGLGGRHSVNASWAGPVCWLEAKSRLPPDRPEPPWLLTTRREIEEGGGLKGWLSAGRLAMRLSRTRRGGMCGGCRCVGCVKGKYQRYSFV